MRLASVLIVVVHVAGCALGVPGEPGESEADGTSPWSYAGTLTIATKAWEYHPVTPAGDCEGTFTLDGPEEGPWCGLGTATCTGDLADVMGAESTFEICFEDGGDSPDSDRLHLDFVGVPDCGAHVRTDLTCGYRWEVDVEPDGVYSEITGEGFCDLRVTTFVVTGSRTDE